jgi:Tol biopolymer transport system component
MGLRFGWAAALALVLGAPVALACWSAPLPSLGLTGEVVYIRNDQLYLFSLNSREERKLVELPAGAVAKNPVWSPDLQRIVFAMYPPPQRGVPPGTDLYSVRRDGSDLQLLHQHKVAGEMLESPYFLPDGKSIVFSRFAPIMSGGQYQGDVIEILRLDLVTGATTPLVKEGILPAVSADGTQLAFVRLNPRTAAQSLWLATIDGTHQRQLVAEDQFAVIYWPRFSPDGRTLAFAGAAIPSIGRWLPRGAPAGLARPAQHGLPNDVYTVRVEGGKPTMVARLGEDDPTPLWSADGQRLLVIGAQAFYIVAPDGSNLVRLREPGGVGGGDWRGK